MKKKTKLKIKIWLYNFIFLFLLFALAFSAFQVGRGYPNSKNYMLLGCWKTVTETNRSITIRVDDRSIEEIIDTCRHETCHEIEYRLTDESSQNETFAKTCNPEDYLYLDKQKKQRTEPGIIPGS
jgi:hypothetical protein